MTLIIRLTKDIFVIDGISCRYNKDKDGYYPIREDLKEVTIFDKVIKENIEKRKATEQERFHKMLAKQLLRNKIVISN